MRAQAVAPLSLVVDTLAVLTADDARELVSRRVAARGGYLGTVTPAELAAQLGEGLDFFPIGRALDFDGVSLATKARMLGVPLGVHVWLDVEDVTTDASTLIGELNRAALDLENAGYECAGYFGSQSVLTSLEMTRLLMSRYGKGCSRVVDRFGMVAEPDRGFTWYQGRPFNTALVGGKLFDVGFMTADYHDDTVVVVVP